MTEISQPGHGSAQNAGFSVADQLAVDDELESEHAATFQRRDKKSEPAVVGQEPHV
jgi:hypothetical protein